MDGQMIYTWTSLSCIVVSLRVITTCLCFISRSARFSHICDPADPIEFFVRVDFQQTLSPQPVSYGLNTLFELLHNLESFLRDPSVNREPLEPETNRPFRRGQ